MAQQTVTGTVTRVERLGTTVWGNPMHRVEIWDGQESESGYHYTDTFRISNDASLNYAINNSEYRDEPHTFVLTRAGRISHDI